MQRRPNESLRLGLEMDSKQVRLYLSFYSFAFFRRFLIFILKCLERGPHPALPRILDGWISYNFSASWTCLNRRI